MSTGVPSSLVRRDPSLDDDPMCDETAFPDAIFTAGEAARRGISPWQLARAVSRGVIRRVMRGVYAPAAYPDDLEHRARAASLFLGPNQVLVDRTAAWLHGIDVFGFAERERLPPVETAVLTQRRASRADGVQGRSRDLAAVDVMELCGVPLTTPVRTALDVACNVRRADALSALDAFVRFHGLRREDLLANLERFRGRRGVRQARELVLLIDPRAESARESQLRLAILDAGLPCPVPQFVVQVDGQEFRLDLAYPARRVAVEYDGEEFHEGDAQRLRDERRRELLREAGWTVIVVKRGDFTGDRLRDWLAELREALDPRYTSLRW